MVHHELKKMRRQHSYTLKMLSSKVGYGTGNLSSYENGRLHAKDATVVRILSRGYDMTEPQARVMLATWRRSELEERYKKQLAQTPAPYNDQQKAKTLEDVLKSEGLSKKDIEAVKQMVRKLKPKKK